VDLPRLLYPPNKSFIYHQRVAELLFRDQPILQTFALENALITVSAETGLNHIQRNVVREWLSRPVDPDHRIYRAAAKYLSESTYWSEPDTGCGRRSAIPPGLATGWQQLTAGFQSAVETTGSRWRPAPPRRKKRKKRWYGPRPTGGDSEERTALIDTQVSSAAYETQELLIFSEANSDVMSTKDHLLSSTCFIEPVPFL